MAADAPRVVLDTQIIVRGLVRRRTSAAVELFDLALEHRRIIGVISPMLLDECARVLKMSEIRTMASPPLDDDLIERAVRYIGERFTVVPGDFQDVDSLGRTRAFSGPIPYTSNADRTQSVNFPAARRWPTPPASQVERPTIARRRGVRLAP